MSELSVRIVRLEHLRVATAHGFGSSPEELAWTKLLTWAQTQGLLEEIAAHRFFGFNHPDPSPGSPNYGYEQWMTVEATMQAGEEVEIKDFSGGLYAVTRCKGVPNPEIWQNLVAWQENSRYTFAHHQWLEECLTPQLFIPGNPPPDLDQLEFDLYLPIVE